MEEKIKTARMMAKLFDSQFEFAGIRFGLDPLINAFPILGNIVGLALSLYILKIAGEIGVTNIDKARMVFNIIVDFVVGGIPFLGVIFDVFMRANTRNIKILEKYSTGFIPNEKVINAEIIS